MHDHLRVSASRLLIEDDAELAWRVIEPAYDAVDLYDGPAALAVDLAALSPGQRALLALHWCVAEVSNGGFDQFFTNPSGLLVEEALAGFTRIEAYESATVLRQARALLDTRPRKGDPADPAFDEAVAADAFDRYLIQYAPLEERFYDLLERELYLRAGAYVRAHRTEFVTDGEHPR